ncbi:MAG: hypothetical protein JO116_10695, partial [Planctomycetaceae bacterium]|nr:hypothetical protein [Planctomycetaceae bacterium]
MKSRQFAFKAVVALALVALILVLSASPASAGWPRSAVVVATPVAPAYVAAAPVAVIGAPVPTVYAAPVTQVVAAPVVDTALVPAAFTAPLTTTY